MKFRSHIRDWEEMAQDPLAAILTSRRTWNLEDFFATGESDVRVLFGALARLGVTPRNRRALDFGCGVGRVTRHLRKRFDECWGIDISARMLELGAEYNPDCHFHLNRGNDLKEFPDNHFDLVYSVLVLQHQPNADIAQSYIREFIRVLQPGGVLAFQMPTRIPMRYSFAGRRLTYKMLHAIGVRPALLHRWRLTPLKMTALASDRVASAIAEAGGNLIASEKHYSDPIPSAMYYCSK